MQALFLTLLSTLGGTLLKVLLDMGMRLITGPFLEELIMFVLKKAAPMSKTNIDDEIVAMVDKRLADKNQAQQ